jgi:2-polyprenyl-6-methoxyphenol hydroxylase-like FAD-dependent oxidoreductase
VNTPASPRGRVAVIGAGPAGMATALSVHQAGHDVVLLERYKEARPAGNILNLWPPPIKALGLLGVDTTELGAACYSEFRSARGHTRVRVNLPDDVVRDYGGSRRTSSTTRDRPSPRTCGPRRCGSSTATST